MWEGMPAALVQARQALNQGQRQEAWELLNRRAERDLERLLRRFPERIDAMLLMGLMLFQLDELDRAEGWFLRVLKVRPHTAAYQQLAWIAHRREELALAVDYRALAVELRPDNRLLWMDLGYSLMRTGRLYEGLDWFHRILRDDPDFLDAAFKWLFHLHYVPGLTRAQLQAEVDRWRERFSRNVVIRDFADHDRQTQRRLRLGYLSGDLKANSVAHTFASILTGHHAEAFEVFVYSQVDRPDDITRYIARSVDHFRDIHTLDAGQAADLIRQDRIDILVSLAGDVDRARWEICARRPAPIQVDWGSVDTAPVRALDYRLTDALRDPVADQRYYTETLVHLEHVALCYRPPDTAPTVNDLPALRNGFITFGSFNHNLKLNDRVIHLWTQILRDCPGSHLRLKFAGGRCRATQQRLLNAFAQAGIAAERIEIRGWAAPQDHLRDYHEVDIALDPFPFNGAVTTLEALTMGVPVITLVGDSFVSRTGAALMFSAKLDALVARDVDGYAAKAIGLAQNLKILQQLRAGLRAALLSSPLCDTRLQVHEFEQAYQWMWQQWSHRTANSPIAPAGDVLEISFSSQSPLKYWVDKQGLPWELLAALEATEQGEIETARSFLNEALIDAVEILLQQQPQRADAAFLLAVVLRRSECQEQARQWYERSHAMAPHPFVSFELALVCRDRGDLTQAIAILQQALVQTPDNPELQTTLADYLMKAGRTDEGLSLLQQVVQTTPDKVSYSKYLWHLHQQEHLDEVQLFAQHRRWSQRYTPPALARTDHQRQRQPDRCLRVGYISGDFCSHSVAYFLEPLLDAHDPAVVETWGYGNVPHQDLVTERLKTKFHHYRNICGVPDKQVMDWMEADQLDILVDLSGHTGENRLALLARKPAPIQVSYLGYPDTTGMEQIDYRFTDPWADRPEAQAYYTETLIHLESGFICYGPPHFAPPVQPLPALRNGFITFGSFNNSYKINERVIRMWSHLLQRLPESRLLLKFGGGDDEGVRATYFKRFAAHGIEAERLRLVGRVPVVEHLDLYNQVDLALDTYPYHGTTTTCEALWMGVPVLSLIGCHHVSRVGLSLLSRVGLEIFTAADENEWIDKAVSFARQTDHLAQIRNALRGRMWNSDLCNKQHYARSVEKAYRQMWQKWIGEP